MPIPTTHSSRPAPELPLPPAKKQKLELDHCTSLCSVSDDFTTSLPTPLPLDFTMADLSHDFASAQESLPFKDTTLDLLLHDPPLQFLPVSDPSDVSTHQSTDLHIRPQTTTTTQPTTKSKPDALPSSPLSTSGTDLSPTTSAPSSGTSTPRQTQPKSQSDVDSHKKRQADRAARNRESSRRAREKQKNRFRLLQSGYMAQQQKLQTQQMQIDHLNYVLAHVMQHLCSVCSYKTSAILHKKPQQ